MAAPVETSWDALLVRLAETPRENGTAALHQTASWLFETLRATGLELEKIPFEAHPYALRLLGVLALAGALAYLKAVRAGRAGRALGIALLLPAAILADLDYYVPIFSWVGAETEHHLRARVPAREAPAQRLVFAAHYDTKTDLLDHVERGVVEALALPVVAAMGIGAAALVLAPRRRAARSLARGAAWAGTLWAAALFVAVSAGAFAPRRSPGALDDGGACAVLVRLAERLAAAGPAQRTEVELLWLAAEEVGVQGSWAYAAERFAQPPDLPTFVVNLEGIGASTQLGVSGRERFSLRSYPADARLVALLAELQRAREGSELWVPRLGAATDARSFLAHGVPAATLFSREPGRLIPRRLHSHADVRARLDETALEATVGLLAALVEAADAGALR